MATIHMHHRVVTENLGGFAWYVGYGETLDIEAFTTHYGIEAAEIFPDELQSTLDAIAALQPGKWLSIMHGT
jgi:hypothetical protein